jgi:hypothetical protein
MKFNVEKINPQGAEFLLIKNTINRKLRPSIVRDFARQMRLNLWRENTGEAIKITSNGHLLDGQHRLTALVKAGVTL